MRVIEELSIRSIILRGIVFLSISLLDIFLVTGRTIGRNELVAFDHKTRFAKLTELDYLVASHFKSIKGCRVYKPL